MIILFIFIICSLWFYNPSQLILIIIIFTLFFIFYTLEFNVGIGGGAYEGTCVVGDVTEG